MSSRDHVETKEDRAEHKVGGYLSRSFPDTLFNSGKLLSGINIKYQGDGVLLIIKVSRSAEGPQVAFVGGRDVTHAVTKLVTLLRKGEVKWKEDEWKVTKLTKMELGV